MAKTDNLGDFLTDIANAIREVRNETGSIPAQDFAAKIREMTYNSGPSAPEIEYYERVSCTITNNTDAWVEIDTSSSNINVDSVSGSGDITCQARKDGWIRITYNENAGNYRDDYNVSTDGVSGPDNIVYDPDGQGLIVSEEYYPEGDSVTIDITYANNSGGDSGGGESGGGDSGGGDSSDTPDGYYNFEVVNNYNSVDISYENQSGVTMTSNENHTDYVKAGSTVYIGDQNISAFDQGLDYTGLSEQYDVDYGDQEDIYTYWYEVTGDVTITGY